MKSEAIQLDTAFRPPKKIRKKVVNLSQKVSKDNAPLFVLDDESFYPHITIYFTYYPKGELDSILQAVQKLAGKNNPASFKFSKIVSKQGFISLNFENSPKIKKIHQETVQLLSSLRKPLKDMSQENFDFQITPKQKKNIKEYGYPDAMSLFSPHLTLTRLKDHSLADEVSKNINWEISDFTVDSIAVFEMGKHGTCRKLIKEFKLL